MNNHTVEPWKLTTESKFVSVVDKNGFVVLPEMLSIQCLNDFARIVACVNACAGLSTKMLESIYITGGMTSRFECLNDLEQQRDELLVMIVHLRDEFSKLPHSLGYEITHLPDIDALISKCNND
jgi:hypothetical protein